MAAAVEVKASPAVQAAADKYRNAKFVTECDGELKKWLVDYHTRKIKTPKVTDRLIGAYHYEMPWTVTWEEAENGDMFTVGYVTNMKGEKMSICVSVWLDRINGVEVIVYECRSACVDWNLANEFLKRVIAPQATRVSSLGEVIRMIANAKPPAVAR